MLTAAAPEPFEDRAIQVEVTLRVRQRGGQGGKAPKDQARNTSCSPRIPRLTRLMALAVKFQEMVDRGEVDDYADLARLGYVTRARITQIMNLLNLAPDLQEQILFADDCPGMHGVPFERQLRPVLSVVDWPSQRVLMRKAMLGSIAVYSNMTI
ncbi:MAG: hypothetical protein ACK52Z_13565 [Acidobacteriota bacterium]